MKTMKYILISLSIIFSHLLADCPVGYTEITGSSGGLNGEHCYYDSDLEVLRKFADNSGIDIPTDIDLINDTNNLWSAAPSFVDGRITNLFCYQCNIAGEIPSDIDKLTKLLQLFLFGSPNPFDAALTGSIPSSIGSLTELMTLTITDSEIDGTIPPSIGSLENLTTLDLHGNALTGLIPNSICNLSNFSSINSFLLQPLLNNLLGNLIFYNIADTYIKPYFIFIK